MPPNDATASATWTTPGQGCVFACPCGATFPALRIAVIRLPADAELAERLRQRGPFEGHCPACGREAQGNAPWLELDARAHSAQLVVPDDRRGEVLEVLAAHLAWLRAEPARAEMWMLQPELVFLAVETTTRRSLPDDGETTARSSSARNARSEPLRAGLPAPVTAPSHVAGVAMSSPLPPPPEFGRDGDGGELGASLRPAPRHEL
ncbi:MAG: hypothetical protein IAG13_19515, partial [Deltaproteobacteria bacterium]|nr:hypothetical protein [Nannocystaceae bacterium]